MNHKQRRIVETLACERRYGIADAKGAEYSGAGQTYKETGADTLANFKAVGERVGTTPEQALMVYLLKHIDSINTTVREAGDPFYSSVGQELIYAKGEGIVSRLDDARNYLDLLECLLIDNEHIAAPRDQEGLRDSNAGIPVVTAFEGDTMTVERRTFGYPGADSTSMSEEQWIENAEQHDESLALSRAGLVEGLDGVWRGATTIDASVKNPGERQTPIYCQPTVFEPETGE